MTQIWSRFISSLGLRRWPVLTPEELKEIEKSEQKIKLENL